MVREPQKNHQRQAAAASITRRGRVARMPLAKRLWWKKQTYVPGVVHVADQRAGRKGSGDV